MGKFKSIGIVKLSALGDVVHALPVLVTLRKNYPKAKISWIVGEGSKDILVGNKYLDNIIVIDTHRWRKEIKELNGFFNVVCEVFRFIREIRREKFDIVFDIQGLVKSGIVTYLTGTRLRIGFSKESCRERLNILFTNKRIHPQKDDVHITDQYLSLIRPYVKKEYLRPVGIYIDKGVNDSLKNFLRQKKPDGNHPLIVIVPGAGWETKILDAKKISSLARIIIKEYNAFVVFTGSYQERLILELITKELQELRESWNTFSASTLKQLLALLKKATLVIGGDTGPIHMAAALGTATVSYYGPSYAPRSAPRGEKHFYVQSAVECSPCFKRKCKGAKCLEMISADDVLEKVGLVFNP
ncbi:MAG: glycosyltransferase family 9 protein [bacterium]